MSTTIQSVSPALLATMNPGSSTSSTSSTSSSSASASAAASATSSQNNFMSMLVAQMQNQDPLNPMDNSQVTSQMAQLSTVTGINQLNTSMTNMLSNYQSNQTLQAANLIGQTVVVPGNALALSGSTGQYGIQLASAASNVQVSVSNSAGAVVDTINVGSLPSGVSALTWNGATTAGTTAPDGQYTFSVAAANGTADVTSTALSVGAVASVSTGTAGAQLNVTNVGAINLSNVLQIL